MMSRRTVLAFLVILVGLLGLLVLYGENSYTELTFSAESGFYDEPFELELYAPAGTEIYYTLDGSEPDENAIKYMEPIFIGYATENENVYSMRTDVTAGFLTEEIALYSPVDAPGYTVPGYPVDKCAVVRAACLDAEGKFSEIRTECYFVGYDDKTGYDGLNIISIITDPGNLFDYDTGIYILGHKYDTFFNGMEEDNVWYWWDANYHQRGYEWERDANIQIFNAERELLINKDCGIRIQGGAGRGFLPRSMNIYAREEYDGEGRFYADLFGKGYMADAVTLFAGAGDTKSKLRDRIMPELLGNRNFGIMTFQPYAMFLDGEYWGVYWLTEKYDDKYLGYYYDVDKDNVVMIKNNALAEGDERDYLLYTDMMAYMENTDFSVNDNYEHACELIDMQSFIECFASEIYVGRYGDWPSGNFALWRTREKGNGKYEDCRWRWLLFDVNSGAFSVSELDMDTIYTTLEDSKMFYNLCQNENFKRQFTTTFMDMVNTSFTNEKVDGVILEYVNNMMQPMEKHFRRFFGEDSDGEFLNAVAEVQDFLDHRKPYMVKYLKEDLGLTGSLVPIEIEISDAAAGRIIVNTAELDFENSMTWHGEYYTDYPVTLKAVPNGGFRFKGWESIVSLHGQETKDFFSEEESIGIDLSESGVSVKAVFEKINP